MSSTSGAFFVAASSRGARRVRGALGVELGVEVGVELGGGGRRAGRVGIAFTLVWGRWGEDGAAAAAPDSGRHPRAREARLDAPAGMQATCRAALRRRCCSLRAAKAPDL
jgi:hypothetical protein